jgi:hypothetical protein
MLTQQLAIEPERDENGYHAAIIDIALDAVLYVTDSFRAIENAVQAAKRWIDQNQ